MQDTRNQLSSCWKDIIGYGWIAYMLWYIMTGRYKRENPRLWTCAAREREWWSVLSAETTLPPDLFIPSCYVLSPHALFPDIPPPPGHPTSPIFPPFIHTSDHRAMTSESLFTHHLRPLMRWTCWMCHWCFPGDWAFARKAWRQVFHPFLDSLPKYSDAVTWFFEMTLQWVSYWSVFVLWTLFS